MVSRRNFLRTATGLLVAAPFVAKAENLMRVVPIHTRIDTLALLDSLLPAWDWDNPDGVHLSPKGFERALRVTFVGDSIMQGPLLAKRHCWSTGRIETSVEPNPLYVSPRDFLRGIKA